LLVKYCVFFILLKPTMLFTCSIYKCYLIIMIKILIIYSAAHIWYVIVLILLKSNHWFMYREREARPVAHSTEKYDQVYLVPQETDGVNSDLMKYNENHLQVPWVSIN
jgi:hypothetical protein